MAAISQRHPKFTLAREAHVSLQMYCLPYTRLRVWYIIHSEYVYGTSYSQSMCMVNNTTLATRGAGGRQGFSAMETELEAAGTDELDGVRPASPAATDS
jgi:hypothetical protein